MTQTIEELRAELSGVNPELLDAPPGFRDQPAFIHPR